jgi:hypothetical protein
MAEDRDIVANTVQAGSARDTERVWRSIAQMGHGRYIQIPQDGGHLVVIETPYDREIIELQGEINRTIIPYGPRSQRGSVEQKTKQAVAAPRAVAAEMAGYMSRNAAKSGEAITGGGDLVADVKAGRQKLAAVNDDELPDSMQRMSASTARSLSARCATTRLPRSSSNATFASPSRRRRRPSCPPIPLIARWPKR